MQYIVIAMVLVIMGSAFFSIYQNMQPEVVYDFCNSHDWGIYLTAKEMACLNK